MSQFRREAGMHRSPGGAAGCGSDACRGVSRRAV